MAGPGGRSYKSMELVQQQLDGSYGIKKGA